MPEGDLNFEGSDGILSEGEETAEGEEEETDETAENVSENDPEKNKKLAEVTMSEQLRDTYQLTVTIPKIFVGIHTNQFFFMELSDAFYEKNYPDIIKVIAEKKYARFAGFEKGRFFIDKIVEKGGIDGWSTELTLNPIPPSLAVYSKMQQEATKALITAITDEVANSGGGMATGGNVNSTELIGIGNELASKYDYCQGQGSESYTTMKSKGCGSCFAWSGALYTELTAKGFQCRVIQYDSGVTSNHMSVQINVNGAWEDYPYRDTNIPKMARNTSSKGGCHVVEGSQLEGIL